ncbi:MAG: hypothetical protein KF744_05790 [Taibaiella sp.]|nr:hypothetical protein [Taibaiella sp.]
MKNYLLALICALPLGALCKDKYSIAVFAGVGGSSGTLTVNGKPQPTGGVSGIFGTLGFNRSIARRLDISSGLTYALNGFRLQNDHTAFYEAVRMRGLELPAYIRFHGYRSVKNGNFTISGGLYLGYVIAKDYEVGSGHDPFTTPTISSASWYCGAGLTATCAASNRLRVFFSFKQGLSTLYTVDAPYSITKNSNPVLAIERAAYKATFVPRQYYVGLSYKVFSTKKRKTETDNNSSVPGT